ncbi:MAG: orotate phosphoribosyltransferase [Chloroflexi bacterium]|nr:orotate phosphoribosyltransferase [Chloroflexota bacterium]
MTTTLPSLSAAARRAIAQRTEMLFREAGALREGHFQLKSGRHADRYLEKFQVLQFPAAVSEMCGYIAARGVDREGARLVDVVCGPTTGGVILAFEVARQLGVRGIFAEEITEAGIRRRVFRRGFGLRPGERVLLVDDILTTGGSLLAMIPAIEEQGGEIVFSSVLVDRSGGLETLRVRDNGRDYPFEALWTLDLPTWEAGPGTCPGCADGLELEHPGAGGAAA